jgi:malate synthase
MEVIEIKQIQPKAAAEITPLSIKTSLGNRDKYLLQIEAQIAEKRNWLLNKRKVLKKTVKDNKFLHGVKADYEKYHNFIVDQKESQLKAMGLLNNYISDIIVSGKLTEKDIKDSKAEQREILSQIDKIKNDLDEIMKEE